MKKGKKDIKSEKITIKELRKSIDKIDDEILELISRRLLCVKEIGEIKKEKGDPILDISREKKILDRLLSKNEGELNDRALQYIFKEIIAASRELQSPQRITYLGPEATFTHMAAMTHFGRSASYVPRSNIRDIFDEVEKGACHYGVVPVENSIEGSINYTLDLFFESELKICAEIYQAISHDLLSITGELDNIKVIYSHPHVFPQCRKWLRKYLPEIKLEECNSTAHAARKASVDGESAAIAGREAAHMYNLQVVASKIEDVGRNITRFLVIGKDKVQRTGKDKTSIMFATPHVPGALYKTLKPIAEAEINMVKLESRPTKHENWSYFFFVDIEGHIDDKVIKGTVSKLKEICLYLKVLGSYSMTQEGFNRGMGD
ncbi:MAG: prephenate dehydratase [Desulfobacterales bacterium]|nr:prephenate dehydratase [Desulfobacterales bacterium]